MIKLQNNFGIQLGVTVEHAKVCWTKSVNDALSPKQEVQINPHCSTLHLAALFSELSCSTQQFSCCCASGRCMEDCTIPIRKKKKLDRSDFNLSAPRTPPSVPSFLCKPQQCTANRIRRFGLKPRRNDMGWKRSTNRSSNSRPQSPPQFLPGYT